MGKYKINSYEKYVKSLLLASKKLSKSLTYTLKKLLKSAVSNLKTLFKYLQTTKAYHWLDPRNYTGTRRLLQQALLLAMTGLLLFSAISPLIDLYVTHRYYSLNSSTSGLVGSVTDTLAKQISYDSSRAAYVFNASGMTPATQTVGPDKVPLALLQAKVAGNNSKSKSTYSVVMPTDPKAGISYYDSNTGLSFQLVPNFTEMGAQQIDNHIVYPTSGNTQLVYSVKHNGLKEDIVLKQYVSDSLSFSYSLKLPQTLEARLLTDGSGSLGIYSADPSLFGAATTGPEADPAKTESAKLHAQKDHLVFAIPAPVINQTDNRGQRTENSQANAYFKLSPDGQTLTVSANNLRGLHYPITVDPTVVITSTSDFSTGNNEDNNISYPANQINRGSLTGGSISGGWTGTTGLPANIQAATTVAYNGYAYEIGGFNGTTSVSTVYYAAINSSNGTLGSWTATTSLPYTNYQATSVTYNGYIYEIGGFNGTTALANVYYAPINSNGTIGSWTATTSIPTATRTVTSVVYNGYLYELGGYNNTSFVNTVDYAPINADGTIGAWTATTVLPDTIGWATSVVYNGYIYELGGTNGSVYLTTVYYAPINANGTVGAWATTTALPTTTYLAASTVYSGYLYEIGGSNGTTALNTVNYAPINANGTIGAWNSSSALPMANYQATVLAYNGYIYEIGGYSSQTFAYTGGIQSYTIPTGVSSIIVDMAGAQGGNTNGGAGGRVQATIPVTAGSSYSIYVGGQGGVQSSGSSLPAANPGYPNGGTGGASINDSVYMRGFGGGGSSDIRPSSSAITSALIIAGGGGGGGVGSAPTPSGGSGGGTTAVAGGNSIWYGATGGGGGTASSGGAAGTNSTTTYSTPAAGSQGSGGSGGGVSTSGNNPGQGGGGGGGWYGGGGAGADPAYAAAGGGGGGSSFTAAGVTGVTHTQGYRAGNGYVTISIATTNIVNYAKIDPAGTTTSYSTTTALPATNYTASSVAYNGYLYEIAGMGVATVYYAPINTNGSIGSWTATTAVPSALWGATSVAYNNYLYVLGGDNGGASAAVYYAVINSNGTIGAWSTTTALPTGLFASSSVAYNGYMYEIGGDDNSSTAVATTYYAPINSNGTIGTWNTTTVLPVNTGANTALAYGGYMYVIGGSGISAVRYAPINSNGTLGTWTATSSLSRGTAWATSAVYNGYIYVLGGTDGSTSTPAVYYALINSNGTLGAWTALNSLPVSSMVQSSSVAYNGYLYEIGGYTTAAVATVYYAAINNGGPGTVGAWTATTALPTTTDGATSVAYNSYVYEIGGYNGSANLVSVYYASLNANGSIGTWATTTSLPVATYGATSVAYNGYLYEIGGVIPGGTVTATVYYAPINANGTIGAWAATTSLPIATDNAVSVAYNGYLYEIGGYTTTVVSTVSYVPINANGSIGTWATTTSLPVATDYVTSVAYNGYIYEIGGWSGTAQVATVSYAPINANGTIGAWTATTSLPVATWLATSVAYNGYIYEIGGNAATTTSTVSYAPINANGTIGAWTSTTSLPTATYYASSVVYNGYVYEIGGFTNAITANVSYAPLNVMPRVGHYSSLFSFSSPITPVSLTYNGSLPNAYGLSSIQYRTADSSGVFGANQLSSMINGSATSCTPGSAQYVEALITLDDSNSATFPDINATSANVTDFTLTYATAHSLPNLRLRGGKFFINNALTPLDTCAFLVPNAPTIGTATTGTTSATVTFTDNAAGDSPITSHTVTSYPGGLTGTGSSPVTVSGLTAGVYYTFTVTATNSQGTSLPSAPSNSVALRSIVTGGTLSADATYYYRAFTGSGTLTTTGAPLSVDVLLVGGGGGGGGYAGGGGGAGGLVYAPNQTLIAGNTYTVTVGAGGTAAGVNSTPAPGNGGNSSLTGGVLSIPVAIGGGHGAIGGGGTGLVASAGGSGGGGASSTAVTGAAGTAGQGNAGGNSPGAGGNYVNGGGGGAGSVGGTPASMTADSGNGGLGASAYSSWGLATGLGDNHSGVYYFAGGGGGAKSNNAAPTVSAVGPGGFGGGGYGGAMDSSGAGLINPAAGLANTGGGGGGGTLLGSIGTTGGVAGGAGVVIIRYLKTAVVTPVLPTVTGGIATSDANYYYNTFTSSGTLSITGGTLEAYVLIVAGGGGGGGSGVGFHGGGGGAGGYLEGTLTGLSGSYTLTVGAGGAGGAAGNGNQGTNGLNSVFNGTYTAFGGGGGGTDAAGKNGGSGGGQGGTGVSGTSTQTSQAPLIGYGNAASVDGGGNSNGGAGAGGMGSQYSGGAGKVSYISGAAVTYAAGGWEPTGTPTAGAANTGNGGIGGNNNGGVSGGSGGSGIIIIRYAK